MLSEVDVKINKFIAATWKIAPTISNFWIISAFRSSGLTPFCGNKEYQYYETPPNCRESVFSKELDGYILIPGESLLHRHRHPHGSNKIVNHADRHMT
jgi:hypothetical protein